MNEWAQNDRCQSEAPSNKVSEEAKAIMTMKEKLPKYVMDSSIAAGFDTLEVISQINTSRWCHVMTAMNGIMFCV